MSLILIKIQKRFLFVFFCLFVFVFLISELEIRWYDISKREHFQINMMPFLSGMIIAILKAKF